MKLLAFTDLHSSYQYLKKLKKKIRKSKPDIIICAGDISVFENGLPYLLKTFNKFKIPFLIIHGNHETKTAMKNLCSKHKNITFLHNIHYKQDDAVFLGYGGGGFTQTDPELKKTSKKFKRIISDKLPQLF